MKIDEDRDIKVTFPEEYPAKELEGKEATFKIKLHEIKKKNYQKSMMNLQKMQANLIH